MAKEIQIKETVQRPELKRFELYTTIIPIISFAITFMVLFGLYITAENQQTTLTPLEDIPPNAIKDNGIRNQPVNWQGNNISGRELKSIIVPDTNYFKISSMDSIKFSIEQQNVCRTCAVIFIRGIKYSELPFVFDYQRTIRLESGNITDGKHILFLYKLKKINLSGEPPWIITAITAEYHKDLLYGIIGAASVAGIFGVAAWLAVILCYPFYLYVLVLYTNWKKTKNS